MGLPPLHLRTALLALSLAWGGCTVSSPAVEAPPDEPLPNVSHYADAMLGVGDGNQVTACYTAVPTCGSGAMPAPGPCASNAALGANDGKSFTIPPLGRLELGFFCSYVRELGVIRDSLGNSSPSDDLKVWGSVTGGKPVVEVSQDGTHYVTLNSWLQKSDGSYVTDPGFKLEVPMWEWARYVRISETSGVGALQVDAVEALPVTP